jgi:hypothetical protein
VNRLFFIVDLLSIDSTIRWREFRGAGHWHFIQHLGDVRNACDQKGKDPIKEAVDDLISGVRKISNTVF